MSETRKPGRPRKPQRPDIYSYHSYSTFLRDWFEYHRTTNPSFSLRSFSAQAELAPGYLPMVLAGTRRLSFKALTKMTPFLGLKPFEQLHLESLIKFETGDSQTARLSALSELSKRSSYQKRNPAEAQFFQYMSRWYFIAIREMATLPDFKLDPRWIQDRLRVRVPISKVKEAIDFLLRHSYFQVNPDGTVISPEGSLECKGEVFRGALTQYHRQMFGLAAESIDRALPNERSLVGYTLPTNPQRFEAALKILDRAMAEIEALEKTQDGPKDSVHHVEIAIFPLTQKAKTQRSTG